MLTILEFVIFSNWKKFGTYKKQHAVNSVAKATPTPNLTRPSPPQVLVSRAWETLDVPTNSTLFWSAWKSRRTELCQGRRHWNWNSREEENLSPTKYIPYIVFNEFSQLFGSLKPPHIDGMDLLRLSEAMKYPTAIYKKTNQISHKLCQ